MHDKNHGVPNGPIAKKIKKMSMPRRLKKMSIQKCQQQNSNLRIKSKIDFEPVALATQTHQHLFETTIFNFINYVKVKWSN